MKAVIQRVLSSELVVNNQIKSSIKRGLVVLLGIESNDTEDDIEWLVHKIIQMRIFSDEEGKMNHAILTIDGEILLVSQFTLFASTKKGNRPSFTEAAPTSIAIPLYEKTISLMQQYLGKPIATGVFGADMKLQLINDGPVTIILDTKNKN